MAYLAVKNWSRFQHYKDRNPKWVKLYVDILDDEEMREFPVSTRLLAVLLLCVAARRDNRFPGSADWLAVEVGIPKRAVAKSLSELIAAGFLVRASKSASKVASESAPPETETETDTEKSSGSSNGYVVDERAVEKLLASLTDKDARTEGVVRSLANKRRLPEGALIYARECATGPGVLSPTRVAVAELKKWVARP